MVAGVKNNGVLMVGTFVSAGGRGSRCACEELSDRLEKEGVKVVRTSTSINRFARLLDMLWTAWRRRSDYDVALVDVFSGRAFVWAEAVCRLLRWLGKPYSLALRGGNLPVFARTRNARVARLLGSARVVMVPSGYLLEGMREIRHDLRLIPNAVELSSHDAKPRSEIRPRLMWIRAFEHLYDPQLAVRVWNELHRDYPDVKLRMVGPDKGDSALGEVRKLIAEFRAEDAIEIVGRVPKAQIPQELSQGDIFLNTTTVDNTPVSILEAMASGLCVVSTDVGGIPHLLTADRDALLVPPRDVSAMTAAVRRILDDPALASRLSSNGRRTVAEMDWCLVMPKWLRLLDETAA